MWHRCSQSSWSPHMATASWPRLNTKRRFFQDRSEKNPAVKGSSRPSCKGCKYLAIMFCACKPYRCKSPRSSQRLQLAAHPFQSLHSDADSPPKPFFHFRYLSLSHAISLRPWREETLGRAIPSNVTQHRSCSVVGKSTITTLLGPTTYIFFGVQ